MNFKNKNIVITGATSGIGLHLLNYFIKRGDCNVCAVGRDHRKIQRLKKRYDNKLFTIKCDVKSKYQVDKMFESLFTKTSDWSGDVDIFIANAGFGYYEQIDKASWSHINNIFSTNCFSPIYSLLKMQDYKNKNRFQFVMISSAVAKVPLPGYSLYSSTKASLDAFAKSFFNEKNRNIILSIVYPVAIKTPFYTTGKKSMLVPLMRQSMSANIQNMIKGIYENKRYIYPSPLLKFYLFTRGALPLSQVYVFIEKIRFEIWKRKTKNNFY